MLSRKKKNKGRVDWPNLTEGVPDNWFPAAILDIGWLPHASWDDFDYQRIDKLKEQPNPSMISLSVSLLSHRVGLVDGADMIICPPWFDDKLQTRAAEHFGLSVKEYLDDARTTQDAFSEISRLFSHAKVIVSHGLATDLKILHLDAGRLDAEFNAHAGKHLFCTMTNGLCHSERTIKRGVRKWPKLHELYERLWDDSWHPSTPHTSSEDMDYCARVYCGLWLLENDIDPATLRDPLAISLAMVQMTAPVT